MPSLSAVVCDSRSDCALSAFASTAAIAVSVAFLFASTSACRSERALSALAAASSAAFCASRAALSIPLVSTSGSWVPSLSTRLMPSEAFPPASMPSPSPVSIHTPPLLRVSRPVATSNAFKLVPSSRSMSLGLISPCDAMSHNLQNREDPCVRCRGPRRYQTRV